MCSASGQHSLDSVPILSLPVVVRREIKPSGLIAAHPASRRLFTNFRFRRPAKGFYIERVDMRGKNRRFTLMIRALSFHISSRM
jgi:hypothetical protein